MATLRRRLHRRNASGKYDVIHFETSAACVLMSDGTTAEAAINGKAPSSHNHAADNITSGTLEVARGGTGKATWAANRLIMYGSSDMGQVAFPAVAGSVLRQDTSGAPYWTSLADLKSALGLSSLQSQIFHVGTSAPSNTKLLWIDTTASTGGLKYHNGSAWTHVPVAWT